MQNIFLLRKKRLDDMENKKISEEEKEIYIDMLCTSYEKEDIEDIYNGECFEVNKNESLRKFNKIILKEALERYEDEKYENQRKIIRAEAIKGKFKVIMEVENYTTEMTNKEFQWYLTKALRYSDIKVIGIRTEETGN